MTSNYDGGVLETGCWKEIEDETVLPRHLRVRNKLIDFARGSLTFRSRSPQKELSKTAYLDGLRGFAAFLVYIQHHNLWVHLGGETLEAGFGFDNKHYFACLPFVRLFFTGGHLAVTVFFVISGYVLSAKPLTLIHSENFVKLQENVSSALFRRWIRLYIPVIATTFIYMTSWHAFGIWTEAEERESNYRDEVWKWYCELKNFSFIFNSGEPWFSYNRHLWSIPVEFKGSIIVYTSLIALSRCTRNARLWCQLGLIFYFIYIVDGALLSLFLSGMLLCDLDLLSQNTNLPKFFSLLEPFKTIFFYHSFVFSLYLGGIPSFTNKVEDLRKTNGWYFLSYLKPQAVFDYKWFYLFWASTMLVASIPRILWLRHFFENRFNQYLGRISFGLYLVHGPVLRVLGDRVYAAVGWVNESNVVHIPGWANLMPLPRTSPMGLEFSWIVPQLILLPATLWIADLVTRLVDKPSVQFAQWLYRRTLAPVQSLKS